MWLQVSFGERFAGIATVGYREYGSDGNDTVARTTTGVVEVGQGTYGVDITLNASTVGVEWDTGATDPVYAHESVQGQNWVRLIYNTTTTIATNHTAVMSLLSPVYNFLVTISKVLLNKTITDPATGQMTIYDDDDTTPFLVTDIYEDVDGLTPYEGTSVNRRDKLA